MNMSFASIKNVCYYRNLRVKIQEITLSEDVFCRKITYFFSLSFDFDPMTELSINFINTFEYKINMAVNGSVRALIRYTYLDSDFGFFQYKDKIPSKN